MNALVFLYKRVLNHALPGRIRAVRADKKLNVPVVMTREEVAAVISRMDGTAQMIAKLLYGSGLRIMQAVRVAESTSCTESQTSSNTSRILERKSASPASARR
jgi:site-specific recombinase XerD